jgi:tetratricopeptide (TPR) repeat protein
VNDDERVKLILAHGQVLRDAHRYQEWYDLLDHALAQSPDDAELLYETGMAAERIDRIDAMETHLRRLMQLHPDYAHAYNALGYSLADRNLRLPEALDLITEALKLAPDDGFIIDSLGWVQFRMGELSQARDTLQRAYQLKPEADVAAHLGEVLWALGDKDSARKVWREGNRKEGDNETLKATLMRLKVRL